MHRWFFANEREECNVEKKHAEKIDSNSDINEKVNKYEVTSIPSTIWPFCVIYNKPLGGNEYIAITGNCESLGNWDPKRVHLFDRPDNSCKFEAEIRIPRNIDIEYRYCIVAYDPIKDNVYIRFWEVQLKPRIIRTCQNMLKPCDTFGFHNEIDAEYKVDRGWATSESYVQFKVFNAPFLWQRQKPRLLYLHMNPMFKAPPSECPGKFIVLKSKRHTTNINVTRVSNNECVEYEESLKLAYTEVTNLSKQGRLHFQSDGGERCGTNDLVLFHCAIDDVSSTLYRLDLYTYGYKAAADEPAYHYGYGFVQPEQLTGSEGYARVKITCASKHRPLIEMCLRYLIIRPLPNFRCDLRLTYERYWRNGHLPLDIGHRGAGVTYCIDNNLHRENTLYGFKQAGVFNADLVELDVQLTKDQQVVVYHDHVLKFILEGVPRYKELMAEHDLLVFPHEHLCRLKLLHMGGCKRNYHIALPFESFTYEQLRLGRAFRFTGTPGCDSSCERMLHEQMPFPLLSKLLDTEADDALPINLGFNVELKWTQLDSTKRWEDNGFRPSFDRNLYVDTILEVVLAHAGSRRIIFSCFDADICTMLRYKQNRYPVMLLTENPESAVQYLDQRVNNIENAVHMAHALEFFGLAMHTNMLLKKLPLVRWLQNLQLCIITWGSVNVSAKVRDQLKDWGVNGIIYDRIDQLDQAGQQLKGNICTIDTLDTRHLLDEMEHAEFAIKCAIPESIDYNLFI